MPTEKLTESDINRLKGIVGLGSTPAPEPQPATPEKTQEEQIMPTPVNAPIQTQANNHIEPAKPVETKPKTQVETELFVKIDEHTEVANQLINAKKDIKYIADTISLLGKAEKLKAEAIERLESHLNTLDEKLADVEEKLSAPDGLEIPNEGVDLGMSSDISNLHKTLENLKDELSDLD